MSRQNHEQVFSSRYCVKNALGDFHPWKGFEVTDSLSGKDYLLFSLPPGSRATICSRDLSMRDSLFSGSSRMTLKALSLQETENEIIFLLPQFEILGLEGACAGMKPDAALTSLGEIVSGILEIISGGLFFGNLSAGSLAVSGGRPVILPCAYLVPSEILYKEYSAGRNTVSDPLLDDLVALGGIFNLFCPHLSPEVRGDCAKMAEGLASLDSRVCAGDYYSLMDGIRAFTGNRDIRIPDLALLSRIETPHGAAMNRLRQKAFKARDGEKHLVIIKGKSGEGKSTFLGSAIRQMRDEWGLSGEGIPGDRGIFQNLDAGEEVEAAGFTVFDDQFQDSLLSGYIIDRLSRDLEHRNLAVVAIDEKTHPDFIACLRAEGTSSKCRIDEIELPELPSSRKIELVGSLVSPNTLRCLGGRLDGSSTLAELSIMAKTCALTGSGSGKGNGPASADTILEGLPAEERSVLDFIAVFRFEVPLSILQRIYSTEEKGFFAVLQKLLSMGLVRARAESSSISGKKTCLVYRVGSQSMSEKIRSAIPPSRKKELHVNIAQLLKEISEAPLAYIYYHLACCNHNEEAAFKGIEIFHLLLHRKRVNPITCFNESFMGRKLDRHLPAETRFKLYLELGDYFSESRGPSEKGPGDARRTYPGQRQGKTLQRSCLGILPAWPA